MVRHAAIKDAVDAGDVGPVAGVSVRQLGGLESAEFVVRPHELPKKHRSREPVGAGKALDNPAQRLQYLLVLAEIPSQSATAEANQEILGRDNLQLPCSLETARRRAIKPGLEHREQEALVLGEASEARPDVVDERCGLLGITTDQGATGHEERGHQEFGVLFQ